MKIERLIKMANDISDFFNAESDKEIAVEGVRSHMQHSWEPRMLRAIIAHAEQGGSGLSNLAKAAVSKLTLPQA